VACIILSPRGLDGSLGFDHQLVDIFATLADALSHARSQHQCQQNVGEETNRNQKIPSEQVGRQALEPCTLGIKSSLQWGNLYTSERTRALQRGCGVLDDIPKDSL